MWAMVIGDHHIMVGGDRPDTIPDTGMVITACITMVIMPAVKRDIMPDLNRRKTNRGLLIFIDDEIPESGRLLIGRVIRPLLRNVHAMMSILIEMVPCIAERIVDGNSVKTVAGKIPIIQ